MPLMKYINIISRCAFQYRSAKFADQNLNGVQCAYILSVCKNEGISQEKLSKTLCINKSNVTRQLAVLEEKGYVERKICEKDKRVIRVYSTEKARAILPRVRATFHDWNEYLIEDFTPQERETLSSMLERIAEKAKTYTDLKADPGAAEEREPKLL